MSGLDPQNAILHQIWMASVLFQGLVATVHFLNVGKQEQKSPCKVNRITVFKTNSDSASICGQESYNNIKKLNVFKSIQSSAYKMKRERESERKLSFFSSAVVVQHLPLAVVVPIFILSDSSSWTEPEPVRPRGRLPASTKLNLIR